MRVGSHFFDCHCRTVRNVKGLEYKSIHREIKKYKDAVFQKMAR